MGDILIRRHLKNPAQTPKNVLFQLQHGRPHHHPDLHVGRPLLRRLLAARQQPAGVVQVRTRGGPGEVGQPSLSHGRQQPLAGLDPRKRNLKDFRKLVTPLKYTSCLKQATFVGRTVAVQVTRQPSLRFNRLSASYSRFFLLFAK